MKTLKFAGLITSLAVLGGCTTTQFNANDPGIMERPPEMEVVDTPPVRTDGIPNWYIDLPKDTEETIYGSGTGISSDLQFSLDKALHQAKIILADKLSNTVSAEFKTYMADNSTAGNVVVEETQRVSKSGFKDIDISGYEVVEKEVSRDLDRFRAYILLSLARKLEEEIEQHKTTPVDPVSVKAMQDDARASMDNL